MGLQRHSKRHSIQIKRTIQKEYRNQNLEILRKPKTSQDREIFEWHLSHHHKGNITSTGQSMMVEEQDGTHWYIIGEWTFFDQNGKVIGIKKYEKGVLISEEEIKPNPLK